jgi:NADH-quinone oxidoreductase subunit L
MGVHGHGEGHYLVMGVSIGVLLVGTALAVVMYRGRDREPLSIRLFANKFYIDEIYGGLVKVFQDGLAWVVTGVERIVVDGLVARLPAALASKLGQKARALQGGHLQGYTFLLGAGVLLAIYVIAFVLPRLQGGAH